MFGSSLMKQLMLYPVTGPLDCAGGLHDRVMEFEVTLRRVKLETADSGPIGYMKQSLTNNGDLRTLTFSSGHYIPDCSWAISHYGRCPHSTGIAGEWLQSSDG